jgi:hypothetical protein
MKLATNYMNTDTSPVNLAGATLSQYYLVESQMIPSTN